MAKKSKARDAEQKYIKRTRELVKARTKKSTKRTPWSDFFRAGAGAEVETDTARTSIHSMVYTYGKKLGKKFVCSYEEREGVTVVKLLAVKRRN